MRAYVRSWVTRSVKAALMSFGHRTEAARTVIILAWIVAVLLLYHAAPWLSIVVGSEEQTSSEVRLVLCAVSAVLLVFALDLLWNLVRQPALMDAELRATYVAKLQAQAGAATALDAERLARIRGLEDQLASARGADASLRELSRLHIEGVDLYNREAAPQTWADRLRHWNERVEGFIRARFSICELHRYRMSTCVEACPTTWSWPEGSDLHLKLRYTARLKGLEQVIRNGAHLRAGLLL